MKNCVFVAFAGIDRQPATVVWRALALPNITRWITTRDDLSDDKPDGQDMEELANARAVVVVVTHRASASQRLAAELQLAKHRGLPILVVLIGEKAVYKQPWGDLVARPPNLRINLGWAPQDMTRIVESVHTMLGLPLPSPAQPEASVLPGVSSPAAAVAVPAAPSPGSGPPASEEDAPPSRPESPAIPSPVLSPARPAAPVASTPSRVIKLTAPKTGTVLDPLERAMVQAEEDEKEVADLKPQPSHSMDVSRREGSPGVWPPNRNTALVGGGVMAALLLLGAVAYMIWGQGNSSTNGPTPTIGSLAVGRQPASTPAPAENPSSAATPSNPKYVGVTPINDNDGTTAAAPPQPRPQVQRVLRPSSVLTQDESAPKGSSGAAPTQEDDRKPANDAAPNNAQPAPAGPSSRAPAANRAMIC